MSAPRNLLRTLLILGRVSNLPTVWSNCLAAWLLNGGALSAKLFPLWAGATLLYTGGMFLNDACDVEFDRAHRSERPIPAGQISARHVWLLGAALLASGWALLLPFGMATLLAALLLVLAILLYDALHKRTALAPLIMAACRLLLCVVAAFATGSPPGAQSLWHGLALAAYIVGLSFLARSESNGSVVGRWPMLLLLSPLVANVVSDPGRSPVSWAASLGLLVWISWCASRRSQGVGRMVAGLLAGIVLVDGSALAHPDGLISAAFAGCFVLALWLQRKVPAT